MPRSRRPSAGPPALTRALREFLAAEIAGGIVLVLAAAAALAWANSPWDAAYRDLWHTTLSIHLGRRSLGLDLRHWVNEGLMAIFFVVVGLEVKRELLQGELREPRQAALPAIAAAGGMIVPAAVFLAFNAGGDAGRGWGIPMATDIAFALGIAALVGTRLPSSLRLFLLTLAIVDDIGAILVIGVFYSGGIQGEWLVASLTVVAVIYIVRQLGIAFTPLFVVLGAVLWLTVHESGLHATLAGVVMGLLAPTQAALERDIVLSRADELLDVFSPEAARTTTRLARLSVSPLEWLLHLLHPWTSLLIVPLFALANAGVTLSASSMSHAARSPVMWGVVLGLVAGKTVGIATFAWLGCRLRWAALPNGVTWPQLVGVAALGGIGFTVSLFITGLAFTEPGFTSDATIGILASALLASVIGVAVLVASTRMPPAPVD